MICWLDKVLDSSHMMCITLVNRELKDFFVVNKKENMNLKGVWMHKEDVEYEDLYLGVSFN